MTEQNFTQVEEISGGRKVRAKTDLWKRIVIAVLLLIIFAVIYTVIYGFTTAMSYWTGQKEDLSKPDQLYLVVLWPIVMCIAVLIPPVFVLMDKKAIWIIMSVIFGAAASCIFGAGYLLVVEIMERSMK